MAKYIDLVKQIADLQAKADAARQEEVTVVLAQIHELMGVYGLTVEDLGGRKQTKASVPGKKLPPKFINEHGETWSGQGRPPKWLIEAQEAGRDINEFKVRNK